MTLQEATHIAHGLIQGYISPDHRVVDMRRFFGALVDELQAAHQQGWNDRAEVDEEPARAGVGGRDVEEDVLAVDPGGPHE